MRPDTVRFWIDRNKQVYGLVNAKSDDELLVLYQSRYYVVRGDTAVMKQGRPVRFTASTLPAVWKRILNRVPENGTLPLLEPSSTQSKWDRVETPSPFSTAKRTEEVEATQLKASDEATTDTERGGMDMVGEEQHQDSEIRKEEEVTAAAPKKSRKGEGAKPPKGEPIPFDCPYCGHKAEAPHCRKDGKPFFHTCEKCNGEFAIRIAPVTIYQAEVAAFPGKVCRK